MWLYTACSGHCIWSHLSASQVREDLIPTLTRPADISGLIEKDPTISNGKAVGKVLTQTFKTISNLTFLEILLQTIAEPTVRVRFARDWVFYSNATVDVCGPTGANNNADGAAGALQPSVPFRTTWSSGWFIEHVV